MLKLIQSGLKGLNHSSTELCYIELISLSSV